MTVLHACASGKCHLSRHRRSRLTSAAMVCVAVVPLSITSAITTRADNMDWIGSGSWFDSNNWRTNPDQEKVVPDDNDTAYITKAGPAVGAAGAVSRDIVVAGPNGSVTVTAGGALTTVDDAKIGTGANNVGAVTVTGPGALWNVETANIGHGGGVGTVLLGNGGKVLSGEVLLGDSSATSSIAVIGNGSEWSASGDIFVGIQRGTLTVSDGGILKLSSGRGLKLESATGDAALFVGARSTNPGEALAPGTINADRIEFNGSPQNSLNFNHTDTSRRYEFASVLSGNGILNIYGGATVLTANSPGFTGPTNVREKGTLIVKGSLSGSDVAVWGVLGGNGVVKSVTVNAGGKVEPGNSVGTIHVAGNFRMTQGSTYRAEINGNASDLIAVDGTASILSEAIEVIRDKASATPILPGKRYTLISAAGGLTVGAPQQVIADFPFLNVTLSNDASNGYLTLSRNAATFAGLASTANEIVVANVLDAAGAANPLWQQLVGADEAQARQAFSSLAGGAFHASTATMLSAQSVRLRDAVIGRLRVGLGDEIAIVPALSDSALGYAADPRGAYAAAPFTKAMPSGMRRADDGVVSVWAQALGNWGRLDGGGNAAGVDHSASGLVSGADITFDGTWRVGLAGGYSHSQFRSVNATAAGDSYHVSLYGGGQIGAWGLRGGASFSWHDIVSTRQAVAVSLVNNLRGDYTATTGQVFGEIGHSIAIGTGALLEPFANIAYVSVDDGRFSESGGAAAVTGSTKLETTYTTLGMRGTAALTQALTVRGTLGWRHALGAAVPVAALAFSAGGSSFTLTGVPIARGAFVTEVGLDLAVTLNATIGVGYSGQFANGAYDHTAKGRLIWQF